MRLTRPNIAKLALAPGRSELIVFDEALPGFGIRVRSGGKRTFIVQFRIGTKSRRLSLGSVEVLDPEEARRRARDALAKVQLGTDPAAERKEARTRATVLLGNTVETYLSRHATPRLRARSLTEITRHLRKTWKPLHGMALQDIDRRTVAARLAEVAAESGGVTANRARAYLSGFFGWAMREGIADANPVIGTGRPIEEKSRDRVLSDQELVAIWQACRDDAFGRIVKLLILTGQRRLEIGEMVRSEVDLPRALLTLPGERTKNALPHEVPLSGPAMVILSGAPDCGHAHYFGENASPFQGWSKAKANLDTRIRAAGAKVAPWRLHDLRRTVATKMSDDLGVLPHVVEAILNHASGHRAGVAGIYNRAHYRAEKRQALDRWADHVEALVSGRETRVIPFPAAQKA
ncbi:tyrosine-type recombinase/integrase [Methylobacterium iners]|uniref:Prophage integrase IntA n=1 Tax=Methylobacterium iners TaxID=418707 RepID=A0ABQ4RWT4_9HYPH|nr:site-specific integrase [Methylobacterium iners]GJD94154.1 Prophage integrase IntA [Methylobacterium iners]